MTIKEMRSELIRMGLSAEAWSDDKIEADYPKFILPWYEKVKALEVRCFPLHEMSLELQERMYNRIISMDWPEGLKAYVCGRNYAPGQGHQDRNKYSDQNEAGESSR